jgi:tetratricopeptide (TPR) repeat protein
LAFAEVHTVIGHLFDRKGYSGINALLDALRDGAEMDGALRTAYGVDLSGLWQGWKTHIAAAKLKTYPGLVQRAMEFKRPGDDEGEPEPSYASIEEKRVKNFAHLGELLRARGRHRAALTEYKKAMALGGEGNPAIQNGAAASLLATDAPEKVPGVLERVARYYPGLVTTHLHLAEAYLATDKSTLAITAFERARDINPFHPRPHHALSTLYTQAGRKADASRESESLEYLK